MSQHPPRRLLVAINKNIPEWQEALLPSDKRPRLPLSYPFTATIRAGFQLVAIDTESPALTSEERSTGIAPFAALFAADELTAALRSADFALLWGLQGVGAVLRQAILPSPRRRVFMFSYVWNLRSGASRKNRIHQFVIRQIARFARGVVVMVAEHVEAARKDLPQHVPVIYLQVGVDQAFYGSASALADVHATDRRRIAKLLDTPFVIMPGDELRLNDDALAIVESSSLTLVRISQYGQKSGMEALKAEILRRGIGDRLIIFERIDYLTLRFLLQHASAYAGLVDSTWQPAGWTVLCESLSSGIPAVIYEGLVSRELEYLGADRKFVRVLAMGDTEGFSKELQYFTRNPDREETARAARAFAVRHLDLEKTGRAFAEKLAKFAVHR